MTSIAHRYADFSPLCVDGVTTDAAELEKAEDQKLQAFEEGYQAGWTDADKNHTNEQKNIGDEFLHILRDLSFTYEEALSQINRGLKPLFEEVMAALLPRSTGAALRAHVVEQLLDISAQQTKGEITLRVADSSLLMLEELLEGVELGLPVSVVPDQKLTPNQLFVSLDMIEREINLDAVCLEITTAMNAFNFHSHSEGPDA
jgi:flagellar assembly protein FliH